MGAKSLFLSGALALAACALATPEIAPYVNAESPPRKPNAFELLSRSFKCDCGFNVCALIEQRDPFGAGLQRVKVDRDRDGKVHKLVLSPLSVQGIESLDDGVRWQTILPDQNLLLDQQSPSQDGEAAEFRLRLARKNYKFKFIGQTDIAGRRAIEVEARPLHRELSARTYAFDAETLYPLKEESWEDGHPQVEFVTLDICYPKNLNESEFALRQEMGMRVVKFERPQSVRAPSDAHRALGFCPFIPKGAPLGFESQEMQISQEGEWQSLVIRLSDGLARATLYEYSANSAPVRAMDHSSTREADGVILMIVCPLGESVRSTLLDSLVQTQGSLPPTFLFCLAP
jgi:hypothetical protein